MGVSSTGKQSLSLFRHLLNAPSFCIIAVFVSNLVSAQTATLSVSNALSCEQQQATLTASSSCAGNPTYQFSGPNGFSISNATGVVSVSVNGNYTVRVDNGAGCSASASAVLNSSLSPDYLPLVDLYKATDGPNWTNKTGWLTNCDPCSGWFGISCTNGRVTSVDLGTFLSGNKLRGIVPATIGNLSELQTLNLAYNQGLTNVMPATVSQLTKLQNLNLAYTYLKGAILNNITGLTALRTFDVSYALFSGTIPDAVGNLRQLTNFNCSSNFGFTGTIPASLGNLTNLENLKLDANYLTGIIPASLGNLTNLLSLYLSNNQLTGTIPVELGNLAKLQTLYLSANQLTGQIPDQFGNLTQIRILGVFNNQLSGSIPASLSALTQANSLYFEQNQLTGSIPSFFGTFTRLNTLTLNNNRFTDGIPASLGSVSTLQYLQLQNNKLTGCIPAALSALCGRNVNISNNIGLPTWSEFCNGGYNGLVSVANGNWQDPATWSCGRVPAITDIATLRHTVTVSAGSVTQTRKIWYDGAAKLIYEGGGATRIGQ
ncbi:leucine-rich repeat domain-containing protein [Spirosoma rhododendri]|uniref:non-specific serine/threonine protein kinase n=1 Tax=Spirosoma rhododendri TaxID=2728024 RepID=A0A7L5DQS3_9BACT|nr:leucine-rich repeat domain-containing protein [Spirosoma rhododendri]QJD78327.1 hypothetical protein HH216_07740 [Spirosoma rhododendri]